MLKGSFEIDLCDEASISTLLEIISRQGMEEKMLRLTIRMYFPGLNISCFIYEVCLSTKLSLWFSHDLMRNRFYYSAIRKAFLNDFTSYFNEIQNEVLRYLSGALIVP
ncbi:CLUMA_CG006812, isoform A [Clunio marinus]|uniref:CLUMA_CG006812, isoform A n=1 Tax=Clunio marinus TaxID=568069 RepID=A0A1J1HZ14_9DIPT|nr:CLUMA_CG006812, isoform A [Clunio marinus]